MKPTGRLIGFSMVAGEDQPDCVISQYNRAADAPELGSQYIMMSSSISFSVNEPSASPGVPQVSWNIV